MAKPGFDDVGFNARFEQMDGGRVAQTMGRKFLGGQTRALHCGKPQVLLDQGANPKPSERQASLVDKENILAAEFRFTPVLFGVELKQLDAGRPQWRDPLFIPLAGDGDQAIREVKPR